MRAASARAAVSSPLSRAACARAAARSDPGRVELLGLPPCPCELEPERVELELVCAQRELVCAQRLLQRCHLLAQRADIMLEHVRLLDEVGLARGAHAAQKDPGIKQLGGILQAGEPSRVLSHAQRPRLFTARRAEMQDGRLGAACAARTCRQRSPPQVPVATAGQLRVPAADRPGELDSQAHGPHRVRVACRQQPPFQREAPVRPPPLEGVVRMDEHAVGLHEVEAVGVPQLTDALEMVGQQQVVVGQPGDRLAAGELQRTVAVGISVGRRLRQLERLHARAAERPQGHQPCRRCNRRRGRAPARVAASARARCVRRAQRSRAGRGSGSRS